MICDSTQHLLPMKDIHPSNSLCITHLTKIYLGGLQVLVSEQDL
jgi:hypothetical protein